MNTTPHSIKMIRDFITDALSDDSASAQDIANAIRNELTEWAEYHRAQLAKAEKVLGLLDPVHDMSKFDTKFDLFGTADDIYSPSDLITNYKPFVPNDSITF